MRGVVSRGHELIPFSINGDSTIKLGPLASLPAGTQVISAAAGKKDGKVYFLSASCPTQVQQFCIESSAIQVVLELPGPSKVVRLVRDRLYVLSQDGASFYVVDLYAQQVETISLGVASPAVDFQPADHGFVFVGGASQGVFAYHFNNGFQSLPSLGSHTALLGTFKRQAVVRCADGSIVGVTENAEISKDLLKGVPSPALGASDRFVTVDGGDAIVVLGESAGTEVVRVAAVSGGGTAAPVIPLSFSSKCTPITLSAAPLSGDDADEEDLCPLCFCELDEGGMTLDCGHSFHVECVEMWVKNWEAFKEKGEHIVFTNAVCPSGCKHLIRHMAVPQSQRIASLYEEVRIKKAALLKSCYPDKTEDELLYYLCSQCAKPFFGGEKVCFRMLSAEPVKNPSDLICENCESFSCPKHGKAFPLYQCRYCCNPATQRSFGTRYVCERCNQRWDKVEPDVLPCVPAQCPFKGQHPSVTGATPKPIGCFLCLSSTMELSKIVPAETGDAK